MWWHGYKISWILAPLWTSRWSAGAVFFARIVCAAAGIAHTSVLRSWNLAPCTFTDHCELANFSLFLNGLINASYIFFGCSYTGFHLPFSSKTLLAASACCCRNVFAMLNLQLHRGCICYAHKFCYVNWPSVLTICADRYLILYQIPGIYRQVGSLHAPLFPRWCFLWKTGSSAHVFLYFWELLNSFPIQWPKQEIISLEHFCSDKFLGRIQQKWHWVTYGSQPFVTSVGSFKGHPIFQTHYMEQPSHFALFSQALAYCRNSFKECWISCIKDFNVVASLQCFVKWLERLLSSILIDQILVVLFHY